MKGEERKEFLKEYKMSLISGSILTISPSLAGILLWDRLPEKIATHFDQHNLANGWSSKPMAVFGIPFLLLLIHLFCVFLQPMIQREKISTGVFLPWSCGWFRWCL